MRRRDAQRRRAVATLGVVEQPLVHAVVERIARDESRHTRLGWIYLEWAAREFDDSERKHLGRVATDAILRISPIWRRPSTGEPTHELGWLESAAFRDRALATIREDIVVPLERLEIFPDRERLASLLGF